MTSTEEEILALGIDVGTSSIALVVVSSYDGRVLSSYSKVHEANLEGIPTGDLLNSKNIEGVIHGNLLSMSEQKVSQILQVVVELIQNLDEKQREQVHYIGVTGQMHGVLLWNPSTFFSSSSTNFENQGWNSTSILSPLITWQDQRCLYDDFINKLREKCEDNSLCSGFGTATLAWFATYSPEVLKHYERAGNIVDFVVWWLCGGNYSGPILSDPTTSASWGLYNIAASRWRTDIIEKLGIPANLFPEIRESGSLAGYCASNVLKQCGLGSSSPITVGVGLGDNPASIFSSLLDPSKDILLTVGTSAQLAIVLPQDFILPPVNQMPQHLTNCKYEIRPYVEGRNIIVCALLCGGSALSWFAESLRNICLSLGIPTDLVPKDKLFEKLNEAGLEALEAAASSTSSSSSSSAFLEMKSHVKGERFDPNLRGSITNITWSNFNLGPLSLSLHRSVLKGLKDMFPSYHLEGRTRVIGTGNGIQRSKLLQKLVPSEFGGAELVLEQEGVEQAAIAAANLTVKHTKK